MNSLEQLSLLLVYGSMAAFMVALLAFAADLSRLRSRRDAAGKVVRERERELVGVGASGAPIVADAGADADAVVVDDAPEGEPTGGEGRRKAAGIGMATAFLGFAFHAIGVVLRGLAAGHVPWSNMYEFTITFTLVGVAVWLWMNTKRDLRDLGAFVVGPTLLLLGVAVAVLYVDAENLRPILDSYWLFIHVSIATVSVGVLGIAGVLAGLQLAKDYSSGTGNMVERVLSGLPRHEDLERMSYRLVAVGFVTWTFTLIAGAIWAEHAWGRPWGWDAKEVWTLVIWMVYAGYLHARATRGWDGRRAAYLVLAGFVCILLNYFVVNFFLSTQHGYAF